MPDRFFGWLLLGTAAVAILLIFGGIWQQTIPPTRGVYLVLLIVLLSGSVYLFVNTMAAENRLSIESNWGGLGGGLGGWRISGSVTYLLTSIGLTGLLVAAVNAESPTPDLRERYRAAINVGSKNGIKFDKYEMRGRRFYLQGSAPNQAAANAFWEEVKLANPLYDDIWADLKVAPSAPAAARSAASGPTAAAKQAPATGTPGPAATTPKQAAATGAAGPAEAAQKQ